MKGSGGVGGAMGLFLTVAFGSEAAAGMWGEGIKWRRRHDAQLKSLEFNEEDSTSFREGKREAGVDDEWL